MSEELDAVYGAIDSLLTAGQYELVDGLLFGIKTAVVDPDVLMTLLTVTLAAASKLPRRNLFFGMVVAEAERSEWMELGLFDGL